MTSLWTRVELLVSQVQRPARCIGCEYGAVAPRHKPGKVGWLLADPDTDEIGLPDQGLQILYELLNERDDAVVERRIVTQTRAAIAVRRCEPIH